MVTYQKKLLQSFTLFSKPNKLFMTSIQGNEAFNTPGSAILESPTSALAPALLLFTKEIFKLFMQIYIEIVWNQT